MVDVSRKNEVDKLLSRKKALEEIVRTKDELNLYLESLAIILNDLEHKQRILDFRLNGQIKSVTKKASRERALANKSSKSGLNKKDYHLDQLEKLESERVTLKEQLHKPNDKIKEVEVMISNIVNEINWYSKEIYSIKFQLGKDYQKIVLSVKK